MCGICGQINLDGVQERDIRTMADSLIHRGPDDSGIFTDGIAGLGHRRLSIIDLTTGKQPISNEDGTVWIVFNGEIYNYRTLRTELMAKGHRFVTETDTETIVHAYEEYGPNCLNHFRGMFAFAIWDAKKKRLFAARDRLGQKPLFYVERGRSLLFASEIKALLAYDRSLAALNLEALDQYLTLRVIAPPHSMYREVRKLPPAHYLTFSPESGLEVRRYWDLSYESKWSGSDAELVDALESRLIDCLRAHMVSDVPVGAFLSGGIDSTLLVAILMKNVAAEPIQTFSVGLPFGAFDESPYARMVAERYGTRHFEKVMVPSLVHTLPKLVWHLDEPSDPLSVCTYTISQMAREHVKVVLGGDGGDELFGGYDRYYGNIYAGTYARLPRVLRRLGGAFLRWWPDGNWYKSAGHQLKWLHALSFLEGGERYVRSLGYFYFDGELKTRLYGPELRKPAADFDPERSIREAYEKAPASHPIDRMLYADHQVRLPDHSVMILDRMTMAHGLEARSPFMDHELAEFTARLPVRMKVRGRSLRYIQMRLAERYLPQALLKRPKQGFSSALPYMLRDEYRLLFDRFLRDSHMARDGILLQPAVDRLLQEHLEGRSDHGNRLWLLLNSEVWYRMFIENNSIEELSGNIDVAVGAAGIS